MKTVSRTAVLCLALLAATLASAQAPGLKRTLLQRSDVGGGMEVVSAVAEIAPGGASGRHSHPGVETGYVLEGTTTLVFDGEAPRELKAGESYLIPAGRIHDARNAGSSPAKVLATYVVEKGKPLAIPAP